MNTSTLQENISTYAPCIPDTAPFSKSQRAWLNGMLAGMFSGQTIPAVAPENTPTDPVTVLFGTETGNSATLARKLGKQLQQAGLTVEVSDLADFALERLPGCKQVFVITSTYGDGEPPASAKTFYEKLLAETAPKLDGVGYSILALGDSSYVDFCKCGKDMDTRFTALGAKSIVPRVDVDGDYEEPFAAWSKQVLSSLQSVAPASPSPRTSNSATALAEKKAEGHSRKNPFMAPVLLNKLLNGPSATKEVRHYEFSLEGSSLEYEAGDALGVVPVNDGRLVQRLLVALNKDGEEKVILPGEEEMSLRRALTERLEIRNITLKLLETLAERMPKSSLARMAKEGGRDALIAYGAEREIPDVFLEYPGCVSSVADLVSLLRRLNPRLYSISSSPKAHPGQVHLTVGSVRYESLGNARNGVCSTYLADRVGEGKVGVFVHHNANFKLPADTSRDVIMVGPGTGIAPFRAFIEERAATAAKGRNWLFFGDRNAESDFLYREELQSYQETGVLTRLDTAFSRDQKEKLYVQHRMLENSGELWQWLEGGASFYVCGDASRMAKDVEAALLEIICREGKLSLEEAGEYLAYLRKEKRYQRDVY